MTDIKKILIIRLSSLGDVLLTTPVIRSLKKIYPSSEIDFVVKEDFAAAVKSNPHLSRVYEYDKEKNTDILLDEILKKGYDVVLDLQNNFRSRSISSKIKTKTYRFKKPSVKKFLLVKFKWNFFAEIKSIPEMYADSIPDLELDDDPAELILPADVRASVKPNDKFIGFAPGAKHFTKMWPAEYYIELGKLLNEENYTILLFGGESDIEICKKIHNELPDSINLSTENNLFQIGRDMKECKVVVCNDSGLMHTATSCGVPVVTIFGSSVIEFGFFPYKARSILLENNELHCRPCSHIGRSSCPKEHFKCMLEIEPGFVFKELKTFIDKL